MNEYLKWWVDPLTGEVEPVNGEHYDDLPIDYNAKGGDDYWIRVGYSDFTKTMYAEGHDPKLIRMAVRRMIRLNGRPATLEVETRDGEYFRQFKGIDVVAFANGIDDLNEWVLQEGYDDDDAYLPDDERWLRKYLYQGLDRWPSQYIIDSLLAKKSNEEPLPIWRGMNFRDKKLMDEFTSSFNGIWKQEAGISSWSPDEPTAREFAYVRKTYFPDEETFAQEKKARETGEKMRGVGGVLLKMIAPPGSVIVFSGGYESEVLLTPGEYEYEMEIITTYAEQIAGGFDIESYIMSLKPGSRKGEDIEQYIRMNHINDLSPKALAHLFKLDGGDRLGQTDYDLAPISRFDKSDLYQEELRFWFNGTTLEKAAAGFYGPRGVELAKIAAKKIFADFSKIEKQHPDARLYMDPLGDVVKLSGQSAAMKAIVKRRFGDRYHELNAR